MSLLNNIRINVLKNRLSTVWKEVM